MARIRTIKPEFWTSEQVMECSPIARLLFVGMWNFCDDGGNHSASYKTIKAEVFPGDDITTEDIQSLIGELIRNGLLVEYESAGKPYWHVTGWHHQKIEKPTFKHPTPTGIRQSFDDHSPTTRIVVDDHSTPEGNGMEGNGKERSKPKPAPDKPARFDPESLPIPDGLKAEKWSEWIGYRRKRKLSTVEPTMRRQLEFLSGCIAKGVDAGLVIDASITNGWQGLFEPKARDGPRAVSGRASAIENYAAQAAAARGEYGKQLASEQFIEGSATRVA